MSASNHAPHQHQHPHLEALSNSVSSTPSSSVQPPELAAQQDMMVNTISGDPNMHGLGHNEVNMDNGDGGGGYHPSHSHDGSSSNPAPEKSNVKDGSSKSRDKRERLSRACVACHTGKTRCSDSLLCQSCIKRGIANTCAYPDALDGPGNNNGAGSSTSEAPVPRSRRHNSAATATTPAQPSGPGQGVFSATPQVRGFFYDTAPPPPPGGSYVPAGANPSPGAGGTNGVITSASTSAAGIGSMRRDPSPSGRPSKKARYRNLSEQELAAFAVKPYKRGTFFVGDSAPVSIDPRLPLRLLLADEERVDFFVGDGLPP